MCEPRRWRRCREDGGQLCSISAWINGCCGQWACGRAVARCGFASIHTGAVGYEFLRCHRWRIAHPRARYAILPGVTRDSLIKLARHLGYTVYERQLDVDELLGQITSGRCSEIFACGTAAIVMRSPHWLTQMAACTNRGTQTSSHARCGCPARDPGTART